ncbi:mitochondrial carrier domain-containing protein [Apiospora marii]|uniref:mitochondrial carrier domain-containing protein n=1 Tax=Apiospora marii TaxID=335849 RepID=UPI00312D7B84
MGDLENQAQAEDAERTPLLAKHQQQQQQQTQSAPLRPVEPIPESDTRSNEPNEGDEQHEAAALLEPRPQESPRQRTKSWWFWRVLWTVLGALVLAVFIKGWVDAKDVDFDLGRALKRALGGGLSGAAAMVLQVLLLMPIRTIMNYQYRHGTGLRTATKTLYREGRIRRYYQGMGAALVQGPVARFGDTAANAGILALMHSNGYLDKLPSPIKTIFVSLCAAAFRMILTPIDTLKTTLQAQGARGTSLLRQRVKTHGVGSLWWGAFATAAATFVGNYPWFATYNLLSELIEEPPHHPLAVWLLRLAFIGFCASVISDSVSNSLRVVKTYRQVNDTKVSYSEAARLVVLQDGISGLFGRGLKTRILANGLQGILFTILWKLFLDLWEKETSS